MSTTTGPGTSSDDHSAASVSQWLVERGQPEGVEPMPVYLEHSLDHPARDKCWTGDPWKAAMFPTRELAEAWITEHDLEARAVEHGFMTAPDRPMADCICASSREVPHRNCPTHGPHD